MSILSPSRGGRREGAGRPPGPGKVRHAALVLPATSEFLDRLAFILGQPHGVVLDRLAQGLLEDEKFLKNLFDLQHVTVRFSLQARAKKPERN